VDTYDALVIDSDLDARMRLKQAMSSVSSFKSGAQYGKLKEAMQKIETSVSPVDVVFISFRFDDTETTEFIAQAKALPQAQDCAFILVKRSQDQQSTMVAASVLSGADGLLFEPFSVDQLVEITHLASRVKKERSQAREEVALKFLLADVINQIDQVAYLKACEYEIGPSMKKLKEMCAVFGTLSPESKAVYYKLAVDVFEAAPLPKLVFQRKKYGGVSSRVAKRMEKKTLNEMGITPTTPETKS
jgi:response regulator RpfG family c-di-GMP phosphodiesterase